MHLQLIEKLERGEVAAHLRSRYLDELVTAARNHELGPLAARVEKLRREYEREGHSNVPWNAEPDPTRRRG